jgi:hypothetical protein
MIVEFTERELSLVVDSLRQTEQRSRIGFSRTLQRKMDVLSPEELIEKVKNASSVFKEFVELRAKLGDSRPVKLD